MADTYFFFVAGYLVLWLVFFLVLGKLLYKIKTLEELMKVLQEKIQKRFE